MRKRIETIMGILLLIMAIIISLSYNVGLYYVEASKKAENKKEKEIKHIVVVDAGHGGFDPGKVGINKELEKDINLQIALKLKDKLEENNVKVIMTRTNDVSLDDGNGGKKISDMKNRVKIINQSGAELCISIHQNSYTSKEVKGAQVFYYSKSEQGKELAKKIQDALREALADGNKRVEKENNDYYLLLNSKCPAVIVECGFLSNWEDSTNLKDEVYQRKVADAITSAVLEYCKNLS